MRDDEGEQQVGTQHGEMSMIPRQMVKGDPLPIFSGLFFLSS